MRHWSIDAVNVPIHLLEKRRGPHQNQVKKRSNLFIYYAMRNRAGKILA